MSIYLFAECKVNFVGSVHRFDRRYILRWSSCEDTLIVTSMGLRELTIVSVMFAHRLPWRVRLNIPFCGRSVLPYPVHAYLADVLGSVVKVLHWLMCWVYC